MRSTLSVLLAAAALAGAAVPAAASDLSVIRAVDRGSIQLTRADRDLASCYDTAAYSWECAGAQTDLLEAYTRAITVLDRARYDRAPERPALRRLYASTRRYWTTGGDVIVAVLRGNAAKARRLVALLPRHSAAMIRAYNVAYRILDRERTAREAAR